MRSSARSRRHPLPLLLGAVSALAIVLSIVATGPAPAAARAGEAARAGNDGAPRWDWPVGFPHQLLRAFEAPPTRYAAGHRGLDVSARPGSPVAAPADGTVSFAGVVVDRPVLSLRHADGLVSSIEPVSAAVGSGDAVTAGQPVGVVASGGHCNDRCVHFGVRLYGEYVNPLVLLGSIERAVLLPLGR